MKKTMSITAKVLLVSLAGFFLGAVFTILTSGDAGATYSGEGMAIFTKSITGAKYCDWGASTFPRYCPDDEWLGCGSYSEISPDTCGYGIDCVGDSCCGGTFNVPVIIPYNGERWVLSNRVGVGGLTGQSDWYSGGDGNTALPLDCSNGPASNSSACPTFTFSVSGCPADHNIDGYQLYYEKWNSLTQKVEGLVSPDLRPDSVYWYKSGATPTVSAPGTNGDYNFATNHYRCYGYRDDAGTMHADQCSNVTLSALDSNKVLTWVYTRVFDVSGGCKVGASETCSSQEAGIIPASSPDSERETSEINNNGLTPLHYTAQASTSFMRNGDRFVLINRTARSGSENTMPSYIESAGPVNTFDYTLHANLGFDWRYKKQHKVTVSFNPPLPGDLSNSAMVYPALGDNWIDDGAQIVPHVKWMIVDSSSGNTYMCTSWQGSGAITNGTCSDDGSGICYAATYTISSSASIAWRCGRTISISVDARGLPDHLRSASAQYGFSPALSPSQYGSFNNSMTLSAPNIIYDQANGARYVLTGWFGNGSVPANGSANTTPGVGVTSTSPFLLTDNSSSITWLYTKEIRLKVETYGDSAAVSVVNTTGDHAQGSATISNITTTGLVAGMQVYGNGVPSATTISSVNAGNSITLSNAAFLTITGNNLTFKPTATDGLADPRECSATTDPQTCEQRADSTPPAAGADVSGVNYYAADTRLFILANFAVTDGGPKTLTGEDFMDATLPPSDWFEQLLNNRKVASFTLSNPLSIRWRYDSAEVWTVGRPIECPNSFKTGSPSVCDQIDFATRPVINILAGNPAQEPVENFFYWSNADQRYFPVREVTSATIKWKKLDNSYTTLVYGKSEFPPTLQKHIANVPVNLKADANAYTFIGVKYPLTGPTVVNGVFNNVTPGISVLLFAQGKTPDTDSNKAQFVIVKTEDVTLNTTDDSTCVVGGDIDKTKYGHIDPEGKNGYVFYPLAAYDGDGPDKAYDRDTRIGNIIPVNVTTSAGAAGNESPLVVAWYYAAKDPAAQPDDPLTKQYIQPAIGWPIKAVRYSCGWPASPSKIIIASGLGSGDLSYLSSNIKIYNQPDPTKPGFNPNEEHAILISNVAYALRNDLNSAYGNLSLPYVLVKYKAFDGSGWHFKTYKVEATGAAYDGADYDFTRTVKAGQPILPIPPLGVMQPIMTGYNRVAQGTSGLWYHKDHIGTHWAKAAQTGVGYTSSEISMLWYYPMDPGFYLPGAKPGDPIPFMHGTSATDIPQAVVYQTYWPADTDEDLGRLKIGDTLTTAKNNCPDLTNQLAVKVLFDEGLFDDKGALVKLLSPFAERSVSYGDKNKGDILPDPNDSNIKTENNNGLITFPDLSYYLRSRLYYNPASNMLVFKGAQIDYALGDPLVLLNVMSTEERDEIKRLSEDNNTWTTAIDRLFALSRNPNNLNFPLAGRYWNPYVSIQYTGTEWMQKWGALITGLTQDGSGNPQPETVMISPMALTAGLAQGEGYVTIALNDDASLGAAPVSLKVIKIERPVNAGDIKVIESDNIFDEKLTLRHSGDFAGDPDRVVFEWCYHADSDGTPPALPTDTDMKGWTCPADTNWRAAGLQRVTIGGPGPFTLSDNWFIVRYYYRDAYPKPVSMDPLCVGVPAPYCDATGLPAGCQQCNAVSVPQDQNNWSPWAGGPGGGAQLAEGWLKRVFDQLNPFDARVKDFHNNETNTYVSMISQIGVPCEGDIALNGSAANLNNIGLLQAYCTVLNRGEDFSVNAGYNYGPANNALINAASRIADFYMLLGNEAYADAVDPTIGFTTKGDQFGTAAPTIFAFENQLDSLLDEELALLRGRDDSFGASSVRAKPIYNRLIWNFTNGEGEVAYKMVYGVTDQNHDGFINENDAKMMYPQGHGDAWGYYLSATNTYYKLLGKKDFDWQTRGEAILVGGAPVTIDYLDERKFARIAAQKAKTGGDIIDLTYRKNYVDDPAGQWQGYKDTDPTRAWGMDEWARRAAQGAYFDWVTANALLPSVDPNPGHSGITKIDRTTVKELDMIASEFGAIQIKMDKADKGLNPLGLAKGVVPFDIDPSLIDKNVTHFEQIYDRASKSLGNAITVFDYANQYSQMLRFNQDKLDDFRKNVRNQETDFKNRLIEIFGYPYSDDIGDGPDKTYAAGYDGPDWIHYMYVDMPQLTGDRASQKIKQYTTTFRFDDRDFDRAGLGLKSSEQQVTFELPENMSWMKKPDTWAGSRRAPGKLQNILAEVIKAQASYNTGVEEYQAALDQVDRAAADLQALYDVNLDKIQVKESDESQIKSWKAVKAASSLTAKAFGDLRASYEKVCQFQMAGLPSIAGPMALDPSAPARFSIGIARKIGDTGMQLIQYGAEAAARTADWRIDSLEGDIKSRFFLDDSRLEVQQRLGDIAAMYNQARVKQSNLYLLDETIKEKLGEYAAALAEGQRIMNQREEFRKNTAGDIQDYRYQDMAFRVFRNDALQKYRASFDLASMYVYLAATAYDYETNLLGADNGSGRTFLTDIVKQRSLGVTVNGLPLSGRPGLTDPMARMSENFSVYKTQMGFNNPQTETNYFSLRYELFRILQDASSDDTWRTTLNNYKNADLRSLTEFNRYCRPFAPDSAGPQAGLVIPFSTEVVFGRNFFGNPLSGKDSAYDSSHFATKVRSAGVWFAGYDTNMMSKTPRVYLVPVGSDVLRSPSGDGFNTRNWQVVDQKIPAPNPIGASDLTNASWIPVNDSLSEDIGGIRRISSLRAYPDAGALNTSQMNTDSRLIGRSVWNTRWLLIIPGGTLLNDPNAGLNDFINTVKDIKLFFQTYSYSGN